MERDRGREGGGGAVVAAVDDAGGDCGVWRRLDAAATTQEESSGGGKHNPNREMGVPRLKKQKGAEPSLCPLLYFAPRWIKAH